MCKRNVDEAVEKLKAQEIDAFGIICHVSDAQHRQSLVQKTIQRYGKIDIVVCNAAVNPFTDPILSTPEFDLSPHFEKGSSVIFITSIAAFQPQVPTAMYGVTKTALLGLTKALAAEMGPDTRVNAVAPGVVPTHFASFITRNSEVRRTNEEKTLLNRLGTTDDMAVQPLSWPLMMLLTSPEIL
ncbi:hypothetical protein Bca52824_062448 [Brassica carinata]|uniref:3-oxoacyl-[acyl-carrier-protein] reductase n=1 Tax=Brassica carinata TaxID=52824 RepID=A0A8X7QDK5_BRACI|nr:hypothetical protein Bca52824_062448 [Brassica carinata]